MSVPGLKLLLNNCNSVKQVKEIHTQIITRSLSNLQTLYIQRFLLLDHASSSANIQYIKQVLHQPRNPADVFSWSIAIRFFSQHGKFKETLEAYASMCRLGTCPSSFAVSSALRACSRTEWKTGGVCMHAQVHKLGFNGDVYVETALVDFYSKLHEMENAQKVFDKMYVRNVVSWNTILSGYLSSGDLGTGKGVFDEMPEKDVISWNSMVSGYAKAGDMDAACSLFRQMPERSLASWNAMISGYVECGETAMARSYFEEMPQRNNVSWITMISGYSANGDVVSAREVFNQMSTKDLFSYNAMIACYAQNGHAKDALALFNKMIGSPERIQPDKKTFASLISACSQLGDLSMIPSIESHMDKLHMEVDDHLATAYIDLFAKSGRIEKACEFFSALKNKDVISYTAMITGYGINGKPDDARRLFEEMLESQITPNLATYNGLLTAYSHSGLVQEGYQCFNSMRVRGLVASADHYAIMVDILGRAGRLEEAYSLIKSMPMEGHSGVWGALLLGCNLHGNVELGEIAAKQCFKLENDTSGYCSLLSNIYASLGRWDDAKRLKDMGLVKIPGCSWVEIGMKQLSTQPQNFNK
ncbi:unnamed protein product [Rhodiola kirilowii]